VGLNLGIRLLQVSVPRVWNGPMMLLCLTRAGILTGSSILRVLGPAWSLDYFGPRWVSASEGCRNAAILGDLPIEYLNALLAYGISGSHVIWGLFQVILTRIKFSVVQNYVVMCFETSSFRLLKQSYVLEFLQF
jgi:hypothetical protein